MMKDKQIILFDGVCNLCNGSVNFVIDRDKSDTFRFAALQSDEGIHELTLLNGDPSKMNSIILIKDGKVYDKSTAALLIAGELNGLWPLMKVFMIFPRFIRDSVYDIIAKNRYKWFGRTDVCRVPSPELTAKFLSPQI